MSALPGQESPSPSASSSFNEALRWALEEQRDPAMASADWLVRDIDPDCGSAVTLLCDESTPLEHLKRAKDAFKTMRIVGETAADRSLASRLYLASIAAALVRYDTRISQQSDRALLRGLESMARDTQIHSDLRVLGQEALSYMNSRMED